MLELTTKAAKALSDEFNAQGLYPYFFEGRNGMTILGEYSYANYSVVNTISVQIEAMSNYLQYMRKSYTCIFSEVY